MNYLSPFIRRLVVTAARPLGLDVSKLSSTDSNGSERQRAAASWSGCAQQLNTLQELLGGASGIESVGANTCIGYRPYQQLAELYFGLEDLYQVAVARVIPHWFGTQLQTSFRRQADNTFRVTLSLERDQEICFPFWALMLGHLQAIPVHLKQPFSAVDAEFGSHFGEYIIVPAAGFEGPPGPAANVRKAIRDQVLDDLMLCAETDPSLTQLPRNDRWISQVPSRHNAPIALADPSALELLLRQVQRDLQVSCVTLSAYLPDGLWPLGAVGEPTSYARLRRTFWVDSQPVACINVERESSGDPSAINAELDERATDYVPVIVRLLGDAVRPSEAKFSPDKAVVTNEPIIAEPPPSSRGRLRAARNSHVDEMVKRWRLTPRQGSVMALLVEGLANKIAMRLGCSVGTVENHVTCILKRARAASRAALTAAFWDRALR